MHSRLAFALFFLLILPFPGQAENPNLWQILTYNIETNDTPIDFNQYNSPMYIELYPELYVNVERYVRDDFSWRTRLEMTSPKSFNVNIQNSFLDDIEVTNDELIEHVGEHALSYFKEVYWQANKESETLKYVVPEAHKASFKALFHDEIGADIIVVNQPYIVGVSDPVNYIRATSDPRKKGQKKRWWVSKVDFGTLVKAGTFLAYDTQTGDIVRRCQYKVEVPIENNGVFTEFTHAANWNYDEVAAFGEKAAKHLKKKKGPKQKQFTQAHEDYLRQLYAQAFAASLEQCPLFKHYQR